jgi:protoporphyrinogen oxidase
MNSKNRRPSIAIIGGGMTGIAAALELAKGGLFQITLIEKERRLGGLYSSHQWRDLVCDRFYHVILPSDNLMIDLIRQLGLEGRLQWRDAKSGFYGNERLVSFSSAFDFIKFPFLSPWQKFRLGYGIFASSRIKDPGSLDSLDVPHWMAHIFGQKVYENFWEPLIRSKLGDAAPRTTAAFMGATIKRLYGARSRARHKEKMGIIEGGAFALQAAAEKKLSEIDVDVQPETPVEKIFSQRKEIVLQVSSGRRAFDKALLTIPNPEILKIIQNADAPLTWRQMLQMEYLGVICVLLLLKRSLSPYYLINLLDKSLPFTGIIESTNILSPEGLGGRHLVYLPKYVTQADPLAKAPEGQIIDRFVNHLKKIFPNLRNEDILHSQLFRENYVQPIRPPLPSGHPLGFRTPLPGVYLANSTLITNSTLNNNAVLQSAKEVASLIAAEVGS